MSKTFGDMRQLALVVSDIDLAMQYWARIMGVDPFFIKRNILFSHYHYQGAAYEQWDNDAVYFGTAQ
jgi:hypothetical protein